MKRFKNILYVNYPTDKQDWAIARVVSFAEENQATLTVVDVIPTEVVTADIGLPPGGPVSNDLKAAVVADHYKKLEIMVAPYLQRLRIRLDVLVGKMFLEVVRAVLSNSYDLVIKLADKPSWLERLFGNYDMHLLRQCPCPVWLMKSQEKTCYSNILAAVDFDPQNPLGTELVLNREILESACSFALSNGSSLHFSHAWEAYADKTLLAEDDSSEKRVSLLVERPHEPYRKGLYMLGEELRKWVGADTYNQLSPAFHLPKGPAEKVIPLLAKELRADLVVMGTIIHTGVSGLIIGNTAETILEQLSCSVFAIKPPGFKTQVKLGE